MMPELDWALPVLVTRSARPETPFLSQWKFR